MINLYVKSLSTKTYSTRGWTTTQCWTYQQVLSLSEKVWQLPLHTILSCDFLSWEKSLDQRNHFVFIASYRDTTNWELTSWEPMSHCLTTFCLALCSLKYVWSDMRFCKWLSDQFNPLGEFSPMRGEPAPFNSGVQLMTKQPLISFVIKSQLQRPREECQTKKMGSKQSNTVNHWISYLNIHNRRTWAARYMFTG